MLRMSNIQGDKKEKINYLSPHLTIYSFLKISISMKLQEPVKILLDNLITYL